MLKNKPIILILVVSFIISTIFGTYGLILSKSNPSSKEDNKPKIKYEYYLEEQLVAEMPSQTDEDGNTYEFSKYKCDNNTELDFNTDTWNYTVAKETNDVCRLYFVKSEYTVEITATNGLVNGEELTYSFKTPRETDGTYSVVPNEGYEFKDASGITCSNDKQAIYDISTHMVNINNVSEDIACKIDFTKKQLKLDIVVKNGTGTTTETKEYGESVSAIVQPNEGYEKPKIVCTNKQEYTYADNKLTIAKLTDNAKCEVTFNKKAAVTYNLIINNLPEVVTITAGNKKQSIVAGKDGRFSLRVTDGYQIVLDCNGVRPSNEQNDPDGSITYTFLAINRNITCNVNAQAIDQNNGN